MWPLVNRSEAWKMCDNWWTVTENTFLNNNLKLHRNRVSLWSLSMIIVVMLHTACGIMMKMHASNVLRVVACRWVCLCLCLFFPGVEVFLVSLRCISAKIHNPSALEMELCVFCITTSISWMIHESSKQVSQVIYTYTWCWVSKSWWL